MKKRLLSLALTIALILSLFINTVSANADDKDKIKVTDELIVQMADGLAKENRPEICLSTKEVTKVYNNADTLIGYTASFYLDNTPYGYVFFDFTLDNYISEFVIEENVLSPYKQILDYADNPISTYSDDVKLYKNNILEYSSTINDNGAIININNYGEKKQEGKFEEFKEALAEEYNEVKPSTFGTVYDSPDIFIDRYDIPQSTILTNRYIGTYICYAEDRVKNESGKYACAVSALLNICGQSGLMLNNSIKDTYDAIWDSTGTSVDHVADGYTFGSTQISNIGSGMKSYMSSKKNKNISYGYINNPSFSEVAKVVDTPKQSVFSYGILKITGEGDIVRSGHAITVDGYMITKDNTNYLLIADGWGYAARYLNYENINFIDSGLTHFTGIPCYD
ncbi:MAG TPA: hypothetical protein IAC62_15460 [Candidatus Pelethocola excrementipullorum]|nr:hypothetical protein [Candidatus Pelethocola excrementipullorum]